MFSATNYKLTTACFFAASILLWILTRLVWFAFFIYVTFTLDPSEVTGYDAPLTICLRTNAIYLSSLYLLHIYWLMLMLKMAYGLIKTGKTDDMQNKVEKVEKNDDDFKPAS